MCPQPLLREDAERKTLKLRSLPQTVRGSVFRRWNFKFQRAGRAGRNLVFLENNHSVSVLVDIEALILRNAGEASRLAGEKVFGILVNGGVYHLSLIHISSFPVEVTVGGATIFVLNVDRFEKV